MTTPRALGASADAACDALLASCSHLFVGEAHHVEAATWRQIRDALVDHAVARLRADLDAGWDHVLMARVNRIGRAHALRSLYEEIAADLAPIVSHPEVRLRIDEPSWSPGREAAS